MPTWLRKFTFNKIKKYYEDQNKESSQSAENSWLSGEAKEQAAKNKIKSFPSPLPNTKKASNN